jgi:hypothetical protein
MSSELPLHYIHGDNRDRRQTEETKAEYFPLAGRGTFLQYGIASHILTLLSRLLRHACHVTVLLIFVPLLGPSNTRAGTFEIQDDHNQHFKCEDEEHYLIIDPPAVTIS